MISALIDENRELRRQVQRLSRQAASSLTGTVERTLRSLLRRVSRALGSGTSARGGSTASGVSSPRARISDPVLLERRRRALARAREARAARRASS
jgi:hypothetical protein